MFATLKTLMIGTQARAEDRVKDTFAIELIDQHIRTIETGLGRAKVSLAQMIQRERSEEKMLSKLNRDQATMEIRIKDALDAGNEAMAMDGAEALARMENEAVSRRDVQSRLSERILRLKTQIDAQNRKLIDLKHGAQTARMVRKDQQAFGNLTPTNAASEAETLIKNVEGSDDPFELDAILSDLDKDLSPAGVADRMADAGFGPATRMTAASVLDRLRD